MLRRLELGEMLGLRLNPVKPEDILSRVGGILDAGQHGP